MFNIRGYGVNIKNLKRVDSEVAELIEKELERQQTTIELIASENFTSKAVMEACGSRTKDIITAVTI